MLNFTTFYNISVLVARKNTKFTSLITTRNMSNPVQTESVRNNPDGTTTTTATTTEPSGAVKEVTTESTGVTTEKVTDTLGNITTAKVSDQAGNHMDINALAEENGGSYVRVKEMVDQNLGVCRESMGRATENIAANESLLGVDDAQEKIEFLQRASDFISSFPPLF